MRRVPILCLVLLLLAPASGAPASGSSIVVSKQGGLGRIDVRGKTAAVLQRDEGAVAILDVADPARPKVLGRYADGARQSLDGDVAISHEGTHVFYARQTVQFSLDGLHVLDISDRKEPRLTAYVPGGGAYRVATYHDGETEWVVLLDAILGLVVYRFVPEGGQLVPVHIDPLPALKVGGPASAGLYVDPKDPGTKKPLLYVTTGETGLQIYDLTRPTAPEVIGAWDGVGLADLDVRVTAKSRTVYAATEYWFDKTLSPEIVVLDATKLGSIKEKDRYGLGASAEDAHRVQGIEVVGRKVIAAHSTDGVATFHPGGRADVMVLPRAKPNPGAGVTVGPYAMDVEAAGRLVFVSDAATGRLHGVRR